MSRLTDRKNSIAFIKNAGTYTCSRICKQEDYACNGCPIQEAFEKLAHYEDLEEAGRLIELPCKVGDTVYTILYGETEPFIICEMRIISVKWWNRLGWFYEPNEPIPAFRPDNFGKTVFLTKAEAEAKLAELKGGTE